MTDPTPQTTPTRDEAVREPAVLATFLRISSQRRDIPESVRQQIIEAADLLSAPAPASGGVDAVAVKALVWSEPTRANNGLWIAESIFGTFSVGFDDGWHACIEDGVQWEWEPESDPRSYEGPSAAQAACQAYHDKRIRSALSPAATPVSEAGGEVDWNIIARRMQRAGAPGTEEELEDALRAAFARAVPPVSEAGNLTGHEAAARYGERGKHRHANLLADFDQSKRMLLACIEDRETRENVAELLMLAEQRALAKPASSPAGGDVDERIALLEAEVARVTSDREFIIGFNHGWDEAIEQNLRFPTMLRKMWSGSEVQAWIDNAMTEARNARALSQSTSAGRVGE